MRFDFIRAEKVEATGFAVAATELDPALRLGAGYKMGRLTADLSALVIPGVGDDNELFLGALAGVGFRFFGF